MEGVFKPPSEAVGTPPTGPVYGLDTGRPDGEGGTSEAVPAVYGSARWEKLRILKTSAL
jgi:hypothetical protein